MVVKGIGSGLETVGYIQNTIQRFSVGVLIFFIVIAIIWTIINGIKRTAVANFTVKTTTTEQVIGTFVHNEQIVELKFPKSTVPKVIYYDPKDLNNNSQYTVFNIVGILSVILIILMSTYYLLGRCSDSELCNQVVGARGVYRFVTN